MALRFDRLQRYRLVRTVLERLAIPAGTPVLDVGGGSGELQAELANYNYASLDLEGHGNRHVHGSATQLPFADHSWPVVLQLDVLEHIPPGDRVQALRELVRITQDVIIWVGPVFSPTAHEIEKELADMYAQSGGEDSLRWLREHLEHGLPEARRVSELLAAGVETWTSWPSCRLSTYRTLKRLEARSAAAPVPPACLEALDQAYSETGWQDDYHVPVQTEAYRMVFVGRRSRVPFPDDLDETPEKPDPLSLSRAWDPVVDLALPAAALNMQGESVRPELIDQLDRLAGILSAQPGLPEPDPQGFWGKLRRKMRAL